MKPSRVLLYYHYTVVAVIGFWCGHQGISWQEPRYWLLLTLLTLAALVAYAKLDRMETP